MTTSDPHQILTKVNQKGFISLPVIVGIIVVALAIGVYITTPSFSLKGIVSNQNQPPLSTPQIQSSSSADLKQAPSFIAYTNTNHHYSFEYQSTWHLKECSIGKEPEYTNINVYLDSSEIQGCNDFPGPRISLSPIYNQTVEQVIEQSEMQQQAMMQTTRTEIIINNKSYPQLTGKLKIDPKLPLPYTTGITTFIEIPENHQVILISLSGEFGDNLESEVYKHIIASLKPI